VGYCHHISWKLIITYRQFFGAGEEPRIWDDYDGEWVTRHDCLLSGPDFISSRTVLSRTYGNDALLNTFFTTALNISCFEINDIIDEISTHLDGDDVEVSLVTKMYAFLASEASTDKDWREIK
jgi:hypothetical protein